MLKLFLAMIIFFVLATWISRFLPIKSRPKWFGFLPVFLVLLIIADIAIEGLRWPMTGIYIVAAIMLIAAIFSKYHSKPDSIPKRSLPRRILKIAGITLLSLFIFIAVALPVLFPALPQPTGQYDVSTTRFEWVDTSRPEIYSEDPDDFRDIMVTVWYPTDIATDKADQNMGTCPVLIFSHGFGMRVKDYASQLKDIASHGYIIFAIDHPYEASVVEYPDGRIVSLSPDIIETLKSNQQKESNLLLEKFEAADTENARDEIFMQYDKMAFDMAKDGIKIWTEDTIFVLNKIDELNLDETSDIFFGNIDMSRVGVFGHSFGGAIAGMVCMQDNRFQAAINMDGILFGAYTNSDGIINQPFMEMASKDMVVGVNDYIYSRNSDTVYRLQIVGARHNNFTDLPLYFSFLRNSDLLVNGSIDPFKMHEIVGRYTIAFFDQYLKGIDSDMLSETYHKYPEVIFSMKNEI
jgi:hypothetical protein